MLELLKRVLVLLADEEEVRVKSSYRRKHLACRDRVLKRFDAIRSVAIPPLMHGSHGLHNDVVGERNHWLFLPAVTKGDLRIPILNAIWDYERNPAHVSFQVALFAPNGDEAPLASVWRFEAPDGPIGSSHSYYHVQPCQVLHTLKAGEVEVELLDKTVRNGHPTFPLPAQDPVKLLYCMLMSFYGAAQTRIMIEARDDPALTDPLFDLLSTLT